MTVQEAIEEVQRLLYDQWPERPVVGGEIGKGAYKARVERAEVHIYTWGDYEGDEPADLFDRHGCVGLRVAEVSWSVWNENGTGGGSSCMQSDPGAAEVCFFAERAIIARVEEWPANETIDETWRLLAVAYDSETFDKANGYKSPRADAWAGAAYQALADAGLYDMERGEMIEKGETDVEYTLKLEGLRYEEARYLYALATGLKVEELHGGPGMSWSGVACLGIFTIPRIGVNIDPTRPPLLSPDDRAKLCAAVADIEEAAMFTESRLGEGLDDAIRELSRIAAKIDGREV